MKDTVSAGLTDQYCVTMAEAFSNLTVIAAGHDRVGNDRTTFSLFPRSMPAARGYFVAMGIETAIDALEGLRFSDAEIAWAERRATRPTRRGPRRVAFRR